MDRAVLRADDCVLAEVRRWVTSNVLHELGKVQQKQMIAGQIDLTDAALGSREVCEEGERIATREPRRSA